MYVSITVIDPAAQTTPCHTAGCISVLHGVIYLHFATYLYYKANKLLNSCLNFQSYSTLVHKVIWAIKVQKVGNIYVLTCPIFTGPVTFALLTFFSLLIKKCLFQLKPY